MFYFNEMERYFVKEHALNRKSKKLHSQIARQWITW